MTALGVEVEAWGGEWTREVGAISAELALPVEAGLRYGQLRARATAVAATGGCDIAIEVRESRWAVNRSAVALLATAAAASIAAVLWPFYLPLARFVPLGLVLGAGAWLVILSRLRNRGPAELLGEVEAALEGADDQPRAQGTP